MKPINKLVITNLRQNKKRTRATLIAIILTCSFLLTIGFSFSTYVKHNQEQASRLCGTYHALYYDVDYESTSKYFNKSKKVANVFALDEIDSFIYSDVYTTKVLGYEEYNDEIMIIGERPANEKEVLTSSFFLSRNDLNIGDEINGYKIVGAYTNYISDNYFEGTKKIEFILTKKDFDKTSKHSYLFVTYKNAKKSYIIMAEDRAKLNLTPQGIRANREYLKTFGLGEDNPMYVIIYSLFAFILAIISIFCMLIIYNAFAISLEMRKKQFGILRSLGIPKKKIIELISKELFLLTAIAIPISFVLASIIVYAGLSVINNLNDGHILLSYDSLILLITFFFIIFSMVISAYTPGRKASKTSPMEAIRSESEYKIRMSKKKYPFTRKILGEEGVLARKNLGRNGKRFGTVVTSLTVSLILFILTSSIVSFICDETTSNYSIEESKLIYLQIYGNEKQKKEIESINTELKNSEYVDELVIVRGYSAYIDIKKSDVKDKDYVSSNLNIYVINDESFKKILEMNNIDEEIPLIHNKEKDWGYDKLGNEIETEIEVFNENPTITLCDDYDEENCKIVLDNVPFIKNNLPYEDFNDHSYLLLSDSSFNELNSKYPKYFETYDHYNDEEVINYYIESEKFKEFDSFFESIKLRHTDLKNSYTNYALERYNIKRQALSIKIVCYSIIIFLGAISISGTVNSINTNLNIRKREFAMLRSMGVSKKTLNKTITLENIFLILKSVIASTIIILTGYISLNLLLNFNPAKLAFENPIKFYLKFPWMYCAIAFATVIAVILFITRFSRNRIKKQNIIDAIREYSV